MKTNVFKTTSLTKFTVSTFFKSLFLSIIITVVFGFAFGYKYINVLTSSMAPTMPPDTIIIVKQVAFDSIEIGDVVTYQKTGAEMFVTHRVAGFDSVTGGLILRTEPDWIRFGAVGTIAVESRSDLPSNTDPSSPILPSEVQGVVVAYFKDLGKVFDFVKANQIMIMIGLVLLLFIISFV